MATSPSSPLPTLHADERYRADGLGVDWILTSEERQHIAKLLEVDVSTISGVSGTAMTAERQTCSHCGKRSKLDDLVQNALARTVHGKSFMIDVLVHGPKNGSPGHVVDCSSCGTTFEQMLYWGLTAKWVHH